MTFRFKIALKRVSVNRRTNFYISYVQNSKRQVNNFRIGLFYKFTRELQTVKEPIFFLFNFVFSEVLFLHLFLDYLKNIDFQSVKLGTYFILNSFSLWGFENC